MSLLIQIFLSASIIHWVGINPKYDYLAYEDIRIDCKLSAVTTFDKLISQLGQPDTVLQYQNGKDFYDRPYSHVKYKNIEFRLFDDDDCQFHRVDVEDTSHSICYKSLVFDSRTTLEYIKAQYPNSYKSREVVSNNGEEFIAIRFFTSNKPTDSQWIMLFYNGKLRQISYFDGND